MIELTTGLYRLHQHLRFASTPLLPKTSELSPSLHIPVCRVSLSQLSRRTTLAYVAPSDTPAEVRDVSTRPDRAIGRQARARAFASLLASPSGTAHPARPRFVQRSSRFCPAARERQHAAAAAGQTRRDTGAARERQKTRGSGRRGRNFRRRSTSTNAGSGHPPLLWPRHVPGSVSAQRASPGTSLDPWPCRADARSGSGRGAGAAGAPSRLARSLFCPAVAQVDVPARTVICSLFFYAFGVCVGEVRWGRRGSGRGCWEEGADQSLRGRGSLGFSKPRRRRRSGIFPAAATLLRPVECSLRPCAFRTGRCHAQLRRVAGPLRNVCGARGPCATQTRRCAMAGCAASGGAASVGDRARIPADGSGEKAR